MRLLHTSDWHLGHTWNGRHRKREFAAFLDWMLETLEERKIDVLIIAGDIFDSSTPTTETQKAYYDFLKRASAVCPHTVIVSGNHDSPSLLDVPKPFLYEHNIHVIGVATTPESELVVIRAADSEDGPPALIVGAVPFLRDRDIRRSMEGETLPEMDQRLIAGIRGHYEAVCRAAEEVRKRYPDRSIPLVITGHLFVTKIEDPGKIREIHVGTLGGLGCDIFPEVADYVALGHIHRPMRVAGQKHIRYSGSPMPMDFDETMYEKRVLQVDFDDRTPTVESVPVPRFADFVRIQGDLPVILDELDALQKDERNCDILVDVLYTGAEPVPDLVAKVMDRITNEKIAVQIRNERKAGPLGLRTEHEERLEELREVDVFQLLLDERGKDFGDELKASLMAAYNEILEECRETE